MSNTILGNYIQLASHFLVLFGFREISQEESQAIVLVVGLIGELVGWTMVHFNRIGKGDVTPVLGLRKY